MDLILFFGDEVDLVSSEDVLEFEGLLEMLMDGISSPKDLSKSVDLLNL